MSNINTVKREINFYKFIFNKIFKMNCNQQEIFDCTSKEIINNVIKGYNGTIFAYGQTGSGKTYTIEGEFEKDNNRGIIPRTFEYIFNYIKNKENKDNLLNYSIKFAFIEIYMEKIYDLLDQNNIVKIREDPEKGFYIDNCNWRKVKNIKECKKYFELGKNNRRTESTDMNEKSSRSHALLIIDVEKEYNNYFETRGLLNIVDLAGSEKVYSYNKGIRLDEAKTINKSLFVLGECIKKLASNENYIPYRESKLTRILKESLGGNAKTSLIVTVSPSIDDADETFYSLNFGKMAMNVKNFPIINKLPKSQNLNEEIKKLQEEKDYLRKECENANIIINQKEQDIIELKNKLMKINDIKERLNLLEESKKKLKMENDNLKKNSQIIIEKKAKDLLMEHNIDINEINNHNINSLIYTLLEEIGKYQKFYENKIKDLENNMKNNYLQLKQKYINTQNELKNMSNKKDQLENCIFSLNQHNKELKKQINELNQKIEELYKNNHKIKLNNENQIEIERIIEINLPSTIIHDNRIKNINSYASEVKLNRFLNKINSNQILLTKSINSFLNTINIL